MEIYLDAQQEELADREDMLADIRLDDNLLDANELFIVENPIFRDLQQKQEDFYALCEFTIHDFRILYHDIKAVLYVAKRSRKHVIGLQDGFLRHKHGDFSTERYLCPNGGLFGKSVVFLKIVAKFE
jgi:hypothetical protein